MRMTPVDGRPGSWLAYICARCGGRILANTGAMFDRDGSPSRAYYHGACAEEELHQRGADVPAKLEGGE